MLKKYYFKLINVIVFNLNIHFYFGKALYKFLEEIVKYQTLYKRLIFFSEK